MHHLIPDFARSHALIFALLLLAIFAAFGLFVEWKYGGDVETL